MLQEPHHQLLQRPKPQAPQGLDFVLQTAEKGRQQAVDGGRIHGGGKGAGLLHRGAEAGAVAEFDRYLPAQSVGYIAEQEAVGLQRWDELLLHHIPIAQPLEIVGDEGGSEVHRVGEAPLPIADQLLLELIEPQRWLALLVVLLNGAGEGGAEGGAIGAGGDEAGAVGGILH